VENTHCMKVLGTWTNQRPAINYDDGNACTTHSSCVPLLCFALLANSLKLTNEPIIWGQIAHAEMNPLHHNCHNMTFLTRLSSHFPPPSPPTLSLPRSVPFRQVPPLPLQSTSSSDLQQIGQVQLYTSAAVTAIGPSCSSWTKTNHFFQCWHLACKIGCCADYL